MKRKKKKKKRLECPVEKVLFTVLLSKTSILLKKKFRVMWLREILHPIQTSFPGSVFKDQGPNGVPWDRRTGGLRKYLPSKGTLGRSNRTLCSLVPEHGSTYVLNKTIGVLHPNHSDIGSLFKKTQEGTSLPKTLPVN